MWCVLCTVSTWHTAWVVNGVVGHKYSSGLFDHWSQTMGLYCNYGNCLYRGKFTEAKFICTTSFTKKAQVGKKVAEAASLLQCSQTMPPYLLLSHYCITGGAGNTPNWSCCFCWLYMSCAMTWPVNSGMNVNCLKILIVCTANLNVTACLHRSPCHMLAVICNFFSKLIPVQLHGAGGVLPPATAAVSSLLATQEIAKHGKYTVIVKHRGLIITVNLLWPFVWHF